MEYLIPAILIIWTIWLISSSKNYYKERNKLTKDKQELSNNRYNLEQYKQQLEIEKKNSLLDIQVEEKRFSDYHNEKTKEFELLILEAQNLKDSFSEGYIKGREWFAELFSEYVQIKDNELECSLIVKPNPAWKAAETVSAIRQSRIEMSKKLKFIEYQLKTYEEYFPQLIDYRIAILDELVDFRNQSIDDDDDTLDPALKFGYLKREEYEKLENKVKFQLALDRYWNKPKTNIEIGRLYERYVGFIHESKGWIVKYEGIIKGFEDFGRDLICKRDDETMVIQCKCWSKEKVIREKYLMQLYGTTVLYEFEESLKNVRPIFYSTTKLSKEAEIVANKLDIVVKHHDLQRYPMIKCNISQQTNEKIYHLPFDQQYDKIIIGDVPGECYVDTIEEAEDLGFRRAFKWKGKE